MRILACLSLSMALAAQPGSLSTHDLVGTVEQSRLRRTVERLASFGTRHTLSDTESNTRGIGAARRWLASEAGALTRLPDSRLVPFEDSFLTPSGPRIPRPMELLNLGVLLPGMDRSRSSEALVVVAHYDSRGSDPRDATGDAPGAVDNASGVAMLLEMAQVMAFEQLAINIYFVAVAGGEQGLLGSTHLAQRLQAEGVHVVGALALDTVGHAQTQGGKDVPSVRLFSEGTPSQESEGQKQLRESLGTENDGASREFARYLKHFGEKNVENLECLIMLRRDRVGRAGDHVAFTREGFPGAQITETFENYDHQRQTPRVEGSQSFGDSPAYFDPGYCARATRFLVGAFRQLAMAPAAPQNVILSGVGSNDVNLSWALRKDPRIKSIVVYRRRADEVQWQQSLPFARVETVVLPNSGPDNHFYAVATVDSLGNESLPVAPSRVD